MSASRPAATSAQTSGSGQRGGRRQLDIGQLGRRAAAADGVDRPVVDDRQQPRLHAAAALDVAGGIAPRAQEGVLDDVLGEGRVIRDAVGDRVGHRLVAVIQLLESIELPIGEAHEHGPIGLVRGGRDPEPGRLVRLCSSVCACRWRISVHPSRPAGRSAAATAARHVAGRRPASMTANRSGSAAARARNPSRTRRWKARSNSASKRVTSPGALRARPVLDRQVEQDRQVGPQAVGRGRLERAQPVERDARRRSPGRRASSRRSARRRRSVRPSSAGRMTSVTSWRRAALNRRASVSGSVAAADVGARQQDLAEPLAEPRAARLAGDVDVETPAREMRREGRRLGRLAGALGSFDRDEPAAWPAPRVVSRGECSRRPPCSPAFIRDGAGRVSRWQAVAVHRRWIRAHDPKICRMTWDATR